jgi:hypothetical protein
LPELSTRYDADLLQYLYYLPIYFQAIHGTSATNSGIRIIALDVTRIVFVVIAAALVTRIGSYVWYCLGALVSLLKCLPDASHGCRNYDSRYWSWSIDVARYAHDNCLVDNLDDRLGYRVWNRSKLAVYGSSSCAGVCGVLDL